METDEKIYDSYRERIKKYSSFGIKINVEKNLLTNNYTCDFMYDKHYFFSGKKIEISIEKAFKKADDLLIIKQ